MRIKPRIDKLITGVIKIRIRCHSYQNKDKCADAEEHPFKNGIEFYIKIIAGKAEITDRQKCETEILDHITYKRGFG